MAKGTLKLHLSISNQSVASLIVVAYFLTIINNLLLKILIGRPRFH